MNSVSLNEIATNIRNSLRGGRTSHSDHLSLEQIKFAVKYYRSVFIRRDAQRNHNSLQMMEQDLGLLTFSTVDSAEDTVVNSGEILRRSDQKIPTPIRLKDKEGITHISYSDKFGQPIPLERAVKSYWNQFNKYTSDCVYGFYKDGYIYIQNDITANNINVRGVFEDPEEVFNFTAANGFDFYDHDSPFPIPSDMLEGITKGLLNGELSLAIQTEDDKELDRMQD